MQYTFDMHGIVSQGHGCRGKDQRASFLSFSSNVSSHSPNFFSSNSSTLLANGSREGPDGDVRVVGKERERWI